VSEAAQNNQPEITIVNTGIANTASVVAAFGRLGVACEITDDAASIRRAGVLVLPGVGSFGAGMQRLTTCGLVGPLRERIESVRPTLAVCLGLQLLGAQSEESPGVTGLGVIDRSATHFPESVRTPQFGWNKVEPSEGFGLASTGYAYFANSYRLTECPEGWSPAWSEHGGPFIAAMRRGNLLACQFHPELSGLWGLGLLSAWLNSCGVETMSVPSVASVNQNGAKAC